MNSVELNNKIEELKQKKSSLDTELAVSKSKIQELCAQLGINPKRSEADAALEKVTKDLEEITATIDNLVAEYKKIDGTD